MGFGSKAKPRSRSSAKPVLIKNITEVMRHLAACLLCCMTLLSMGASDAVRQSGLEVFTILDTHAVLASLLVPAAAEAYVCPFTDDKHPNQMTSIRPALFCTCLHPPINCWCSC